MAVFLSDEELESFSNTRGYSVLVVGDDDLARKLVHVFGVGRGSLVVASDGPEGLRFLTSPSHDRFSLVVSEAEIVARGWGYGSLCLHVHERNTAGMRLYEKLGFATVEDGSASWRDWSLWHGDEPSGVGFAWPSVGRRVYMERLHAGEETLAARQ
ncbi:hypothetical protein EMIHUDRAFT_197782 [Emiliania huxleyi CCMP1516]|uniref:N-acetyltransferase domain-containing protein n=2 Tax=Emiliania huxleyi TaxID=2903 RepID=A0A0D3IDR3_EMIH1|nr:hypothetical protein EMIHUDRAFT_197782 [Emiliania huxleyi CCMP1516]EOD09398.1 hypothetical protein EMIHUDRAFT_197782 [Emiliania huxleyi CCMP1516]|eukprot:XP_005761827.1 hypothetical protein EMIHUDRAFT_197782 [Emiliania huxleyi CCMP1516]